MTAISFRNDASSKAHPSPEILASPLDSGKTYDISIPDPDFRPFLGTAVHFLTSFNYGSSVISELMFYLLYGMHPPRRF
ncbi:hypothetical protein EDD85DRAFT_960020 [Armillaria nabsnona]|nr:hypothetical protein EDD85DRAFT_960020 [Armillaria nabsnona]